MVNPNNNQDKKKEHFYETNDGKFIIGVIILLLIALAVYFLIKSCNKSGANSVSSMSSPTSTFGPLTQTPGQGSPTSVEM